jgi:hypothetical protein
MTTLAVMTKDPDETLDYDVDFVRWLPVSDTITSAVAEITDTTATITQTDVSSTSIKVWITGGTAGDNGKVTVRATTDQGRVKEASFRIRIKDS